MRILEINDYSITLDATKAKGTIDQCKFVLSTYKYDYYCCIHKKGEILKDIEEKYRKVIDIVNSKNIAVIYTKNNIKDIFKITDDVDLSVIFDYVTYSGMSKAI